MGAETDTVELNEAEAKQTLELFAKDPCLASLNAKVMDSRFNIFDALRMVRAEVRHSNFLAWLLDPEESHLQGPLFLRAFVGELVATAGRLLPDSKLPHIGKADCDHAIVERESDNIDLLIRLESLKVAILVENKIDAALYNDLARYRRAVTEAYPEYSVLCVVLSRKPERISAEGWVQFGYDNLYETISKCASIAERDMAPDAFAFLHHYLRILRSRLMNDPEVDELCRQLLAKHRTAIDLIRERGDTGHRLVMPMVRRLLDEQRDRWEVTKRYSPEGRSVDFMPANWKDVIPPVGNWSRFNRHIWLTLGITWRPTHLTFWAGAWSTDDARVRETVINRLTCDPNEFGLRRGKSSDSWVSMAQKRLKSWEETSPPPLGEFETSVSETLDFWHQRLLRSADALRPIFDEWKKSHR